MKPGHTEGINVCREWVVQVRIGEVFAQLGKSNLAALPCYHARTIVFSSGEIEVNEVDLERWARVGHEQI